MADEEVSEQPATQEAPSEETPTEQPVQEQPQAAPVEQAQPAIQESSAVQEQPVDVPQEPEPVEQAPPEPKSPHVAELEEILHHIHTLLKSAQKALEYEDHANQDGIQRVLKHYSRDLEHLPVTLQLLNDYRRHFDDIKKHAESVRASLVTIRKSDDALSSEEARVIIATDAVKETIVQIIEQLEQLFNQVRSSTHVLLEVIGYDSPGFEEFIEPQLSAINLQEVVDALSQAHATIEQLHHDMEDLEALDTHAQELQEPPENV